MKFEIKIVIVSLVFSFLCMLAFTYACSFNQQKLYAYQVGIYKEEANKNDKLNELKKDGYQGYVYSKNNQFYVLSMITDQYNEIKEHSQKLKGIIKEYTVASDINAETLLDNLAKGDIDD